MVSQQEQLEMVRQKAIEMKKISEKLRQRNLTLKAYLLNDENERIINGEFNSAGDSSYNIERIINNVGQTRLRISIIYFALFFVFFFGLKVVIQSLGVGETFFETNYWFMLFFITFFVGVKILKVAFPEFLTNKMFWNGFADDVSGDLKNHLKSLPKESLKVILYNAFGQADMNVNSFPKTVSNLILKVKSKDFIEEEVKTFKDFLKSASDDQVYQWVGSENFKNLVGIKVLIRAMRKHYENQESLLW